MAKLSVPTGDPIHFTLRYILDQRGREDFISETGHFPPPVFTVPISLPDLSPELRRRAYQLYVRSLPTEEEVEKGFDAGVPPEDFFEPEELFPQLRAPTDDPALVIDAWENFHSKIDDARAAIEKARRDEKDREKVHRAAFHLEMASWIADYGSERLKIAHGRGYKINTLYARERARAEFPGFDLDTNGKALWRERMNPSEDALALESAVLRRVGELAREYPVRIGYLTRDVAGKELTGSDRHEVVVVSDYLYFYRLVGDPDDVDLPALGRSR